MTSTVNKAAPRTPGRGWRWLARLLWGLVILLLVLVSMGALYQAVGAARDRAAFPPPGQLVDVGGHRLHLYCTGEATAGRPTVILETLSGGIGAYWGWVQPEIAKQTRVCSYDRAGRAWSEPASEPLSLAQTVRDLHALLANAGVDGPYVLVGHSIGGIYVRKFAADYPNEVVGMVLVDAGHPEQFARHPELLAANESFLQISATFPWLARVGLFRLYFAAGGTLDMGELPPTALDVAKTVWSTPAYFESQRAEGMAGQAIFADGQHLSDLGDLPLVVVSAGAQQPAMWASLQAELATLSTNAQHITVDRATHQSLAFNPEDAQVTSAAILQVVEAAAGHPR
ncbi:MAG: alpha/beta fold hydrolase [Caldilineaceae bacterium]|nr:alpha/beta fold hydrolase [Caldilineaceae bacterium]